VTLLAANPDFAPIEVDTRKQDFVIEGLGVGVIRTIG
jgi:repressor LexA